MTPTREELIKTKEFADMVLEIGMSDETIIPVWPIETEMVVTHPLTVGMIRTIRALIENALQEPRIEGLEHILNEYDQGLSLNQEERAKVFEAARYVAKLQGKVTGDKPCACNVTCYGPETECKCDK